MKTFNINSYPFTSFETAELIEAAGSRKAALELAILQAESRSRSYKSPCTWTAYYSRKTGDIVVKRHSRRLAS